MEKSSSASPITNPDVSAGANSHSRLYIPSLDGIRTLKWIRFLGVLSYSLYLVHDTVILAVEMYLPQLHKVLQGGISLLISFGLAYVIYQFLEFPLGQLRKKFSRA
ncbi:MAG: hypothetical protein V7K92_29370 [Nostoc sp.]|uniref:acyltransferase family protein n=1 Tax=Nostoc sp. TaxID=1180 RepID=UPI002FF06A35